MNATLDETAAVLKSPCTHRQLKSALEAFLLMDPIDAANDADKAAGKAHDHRERQRANQQPREFDRREIRPRPLPC